MLCLSNWYNIAKEYCTVYQVDVVKYVWGNIAQESYLRNVGPERTYIILSQKNWPFQMCLVAFLLTGYNITEQSWLALFNAGSEVHLKLAWQQWIGVDIDWNIKIKYFWKSLSFGRLPYLWSISYRPSHMIVIY